MPENTVFVVMGSAYENDYIILGAAFDLENAKALAQEHCATGQPVWTEVSPGNWAADAGRLVLKGWDHIGSVWQTRGSQFERHFTLQEGSQYDLQIIKTVIYPEGASE